MLNGSNQPNCLTRPRAKTPRGQRTADLFYRSTLHLLLGSDIL